MRNNCLAKRGVSLITVLIFMMIATIATTATYKWLSTAGFTSGDRMAMSEAKEASHAGLESVRSWMTYHANDVGAILRQYYDGGKKPVALTNVVRSMNSSKQVFKVWLTGVETSGSAYKFTIVSNGLSNGGAKYSETSVLKVRGLYKVREPEVVMESPVDFRHSYFGGSMEGSGDNKNTSMVINGNWKGNPTGVSEDFIVTGKVELSGSNVNLGRHACIGGDLKLQNEGATAGDIYVKGATTNLSASITGNAVFDKSVGSTTAGHGIEVAGDLTLKGTYTTEQTKRTRIRGNLCVEAGGQLDIGNLYQDFTVERSVNVKTNTLFSRTMSQSTIGHTNFGGSGYSIYMPNLNACNSDNNPVVNCKSGLMHQSYGVFKTSAIPVSTPNKTMYCDTSIIAYCDSILGKPTKGCDNTKYKIKDMITTAYDSFKQLVDKVPCAKITGSNTNNFNMATLNQCYRNVSNTPNLMYHGYLVVGVHGSGDQSIFKNPSGRLEGNFIFVSENKISMLKLPPTTDTSKVFFYMAKGAGMVNTPSSKVHERYNYFVYSKENIDELQHSNDVDTLWSGSFYLTADNCAGIKHFNKAHMGIQYNHALVQSLVDNAIICGINEEGSCGSLVNNHEDDINHDGEELNVEAGYDPYYVATAPQLSISLESQRRNKEILYDNLSSSEYTTVKPSIVILPRIIYMSDLPTGKLSQYFKVINLNGAKETYGSGRTKCTPNIETENPITDGTPLEHPVYKCEYTAKKSSYGTIPFWLVVDAQAAQKSAVNFVGTESRIFGGGSVTVKMNADGSQHEPITVSVRMTEIPDGWQVHTSGDYVTAGEVEDDGSRMYTVILTPGMETPVFVVSSEAGLDNNQINFTITSVGENGRMGSPVNHSVWLDGAATVVRDDIPKTGFCDGNKHKTINGVSCSEIVTRPECTGNLVVASAGDWIRPSCPDITTQDPNKRWGCGLADAEDVELQRTRNASPYCDVFIPDSSIDNLQDGHTYTLYASYKAKEFTLKVFLNGASKSKVEVRTSDQIIDANTPLNSITSSMCTAGDTCRVKVFAGRHIQLRHQDGSGEEFKTWNFLRSDGSVDSVSSSDKMAVSLLHDTLVVAEYDDIENHCFYTDFKDVRIWCNGSTDNCIDTCQINNKNSSCHTDGDGQYPTSDWLLPRTNNGQKYSKPKISSGKFIYYSAGKNANSGNSTISYLLNRTQAGGHGTLTSRFKACSREMKGNSYTPLNSGFILRSTDNASRYSIVQVYGRASQVTSVGNYVMEVRVCEGDGSGIKNENQGACKKASFPGITLTPAEFGGIVFNTDIEVFGDSAKVKLSYKRDGSWVRSSVNIPLLVGATLDEYVGLSMADDCFKVMNLGWSSDDWDPEHCFDIPNVTCSFAANYLGGILPLNEDVKPWVGTSSYFNDPANADKLRPGCSMTYHYNGCDLASGYAKHSCETWLDGSTHCGSCSADSDGPYFVSGVYADRLERSKGDKYNFTYAGLHGTAKSYDFNGTIINGAVRDASVTIDCSDEAQGGNGHTYETTCGRFVVGHINECSQGTSFVIDDCDNQLSCVASVSGGVANLRSSSIMGEISGLPDTDGSGNIPVVSMVMMDANGIRSQEFLISGNGTFSRSVDLMSDMQDFDPERVVSVEFTGSNDFTVASLVSDCPNSVGVHGCEASLDGDRFVISSSLMNADEALCKVKGVDNSYETEEKDCPPEGKFYLPAVDLQKNINISGGDRTFTFTVSVKPKGGGDEMTCTTAPVDVLSNELTCSLSSTVPVNPGDNLPALNYQITNCPQSGCVVEARIGSEAPVRLTYRGNGQVNSWSPTINTTPGNYRYTLSYAGLTCTADITVVTGANGSTAENCAIDEVSKRFTADLNLAVGNTNSIKLWYMDKLGNIIDRSKNVSPSTTRFDEPLPTMTEAGEYIVALSINGEEVCSVPYTFAGEEPEPEADCYIENGRFKSRNKNTTGQTMYSVSLNYSTDGTPYGNTVSSGSWPKDGYVDMDAYLPTAPGTYTYNLWGSGLLCSVTYEVKDESEENP